MTSQSVSSSAAVTSDDKLWGLLDYLFNPLIPIITLLMEDKKARPFIKYHSVQALAYFVVYFVLISVLSAITFGIGGFILALAAFVFSVIFCVKAYQGQWFEIPVITSFCKKQGWM